MTVARIFASVLLERAFLTRVRSVFEDLSFGGEINCLAQMHVGDADRHEESPKSGFSMGRRLLAIEEEEEKDSDTC